LLVHSMRAAPNHPGRARRVHLLASSPSATGFIPSEGPHHSTVCVTRSNRVHLCCGSHPRLGRLRRRGFPPPGTRPGGTGISSGTAPLLRLHVERATHMMDSFHSMGTNPVSWRTGDTEKTWKNQALVFERLSLLSVPSVSPWLKKTHRASGESSHAENILRSSSSARPSRNQPGAHGRPQGGSAAQS
jgi:hypothetical protein